MRLTSIFVLLLLTAFTPCFSQQPDSIQYTTTVAVKDTPVRAVPAALELNALRAYNAAHAYKALHKNCLDYSQELQAGKNSSDSALVACEKETGLHQQLDALNAARIRKLMNESFWKDVKAYTLTGIVIVESVAIYVLVLRH